MFTSVCIQYEADRFAKVFPGTEESSGGLKQLLEKMIAVESLTHIANHPHNLLSKNILTKRFGP